MQTHRLIQPSKIHEQNEYSMFFLLCNQLQGTGIPNEPFISFTRVVNNWDVQKRHDTYN